MKQLTNIDDMSQTNFTQSVNKKLKDYTIYVSSLMYADEIYNDLVESGVDITRCIFNQLDLSKDTVERYKKYKME